jgi:hypothetical protein
VTDSGARRLHASSKTEPIIPVGNGTAAKRTRGSDPNDIRCNLVPDKSPPRKQVHSSTAPLLSTSNKSASQSIYAGVDQQKLFQRDSRSDAELSPQCQIPVQHQEERCTPSSSAIEPPTFTGNLQQAGSLGALSAAEAKAWEDNAMNSQTLLVAPSYISLALGSVAMTDGSGPPSARINNRTGRRPRVKSPRKRLSGAQSKHFSSILDSQMIDDTDNATICGILAFSSKVGLGMSGDYSGALQQQPSASAALVTHTSVCPKIDPDQNPRNGAFPTSCTISALSMLLVSCCKK